MSTLDLPEQLSLSETVLYGGERQWRLARVELVNWGTFGGFHQLAVSRKGLLITGSSGSGKSTLLDAITTVLTPPQARQLNAAARSDSSRGDDRTLVSYIRGAWRRSADELGEVVSSYLRPTTATWSGILLQYRCVDESLIPSSLSKQDEPIALVVLFNLKAGSNSAEGLKTMYLVVRGEHSLPEFQAYIAHGIEVRKAKREIEGARVFTAHAPFESHFRRLMGIRSRKTLELLHKTQAAKNFGSLDDLLRNFMLDEPETFGLAASAVEQFTALDLAHKNVVDQREQMEALEPLLPIRDAVEQTLRLQKENAELEDHLDACTNQILLECKREQLESAEEGLDALNENVELARADLARKQGTLRRARSIADQQGGIAIDTAELGILTRKQQLHDVEVNRSGLLADLAPMGIADLPHARSEWDAFKRDIERHVEELTQSEERERDERRRVQGRPALLRDALEEIDRELRHLRQRPSNIPRAHDQLRCDIARTIGVRADDLPYMGELISVKPEFSDWQGAIERLIGKRALTLLVPANLIKVVARTVEHRNLGLRLEYVAVPKGVEVPDRTLSARSTVRRLEVHGSSAHPEFALWVHRELRTRWNFECVDSTDEFDRYDFALTVHGQIKQRQRHIKDDRFSIDDRKRWYLGADNDQKIEEYLREHKRLESELAEAEQAASAIERRQHDAQSLRHAVHTLNERSWSNYDIDGQKEDLAKQEEDLRKLLKSNTNLTKANEEEKRAQEAVQHADELLRTLLVSQESQQNSVNKLTREVDELHARTASTLLPGSVFQSLREEFAAADRNYKKDAERIYQTQRRVSKRLGRRRDELIKQEHEQKSEAQLIMQRYRGRWPKPSANLSAAYEDIDGYLGIYGQIKATGLPKHESQFLDVLRQFSQDQITLLASTIRSAPAEIATKLEPVNESLRMADYNPGTHLEIVMESSRSAEATEFLGELNRISSGSFDSDTIEDAEPRFEAAAALIRRLGSSERDDQRWRRRCLDTRLHVKFVAHELDERGAELQVYDSDVGLSGGQKQKLVIYCLAAALRYQLAEEGRMLPRYGTVVLDEAFDKADYQFASSALEIFEAFGFHMVLATPLRHLQTIERHVGGITVVKCFDSRRSRLFAVPFEEIMDDGEETDEEEFAVEGEAQNIRELAEEGEAHEVADQEAAGTEEIVG